MATTAVTAVLVFFGAIFLAIVALLRAVLALCKIGVALFPVAGPLLQVYLLLALQWKATELVAPSLRPGLSVPWLSACGVALGEWLVLHVFFIVLQVIVVRRIEVQRLQRLEARDADEDDNVSRSSDEELYPQERNHA